MDETSEVLMETDVSSTTDDVLEMQEVTGSQGHIEMVVVVEKIDEDAQSPVGDSKETKNEEVDKGSEVEAQVSSQISPQKISSPQSDSKQTSPKPAGKPIIIQKPSLQSPIKENQILVAIQKTPTKTVSPIKIVIADNSIINSTTNTPNQLNKMEESKVVANTSIQQDAIEKENKNENELPDPVAEVQETVAAQKTAIKNIQEDNPSKSPVKITSIEEITTVTNSNTDNTDSTNQKDTTSVLLPMYIEAEISNDSQTENNSDTADRDHNKSISRELKSLINSAKESKIISECTQLTSKMRKSRSALESANTSLNTSVEAEKIQGRRSSTNSQKSNCSEKSEKAQMKRSMRSQNPEFVNKVKQFLNSVTGRGTKEVDVVQMNDEEIEDTEKVEREGTPTSPKKKKISQDSAKEKDDKSSKLHSDSYCWRCHYVVEPEDSDKTQAPVQCSVCPRSYHHKCLSGTERSKLQATSSWVCPECLLILNAESSETRSHAMKKISLGTLCELLKYAMQRMMDLNGVIRQITRTALLTDMILSNSLVDILYVKFENGTASVIIKSD